MRPKGLSFVRSTHADRRRLILRLVVAALCGLASALIGILLKHLIA